VERFPFPGVLSIGFAVGRFSLPVNRPSGISTMQTFRQTRHWFAFTLVLGLVFNLAGLPAYAACEHLGTIAAPAAAQEMKSGACGMPADKGSCCCGPESREASGADAESGAGLHSPACGCTLEAPSTPVPAERERVSLNLRLPAFVVAAAYSILLPLPAASAPVRPALSEGRPRTLGGSPASSRAPPAD